MDEQEHAQQAVARQPEHHQQGLPQLDPSSFSSQLFWLTLTFVALYVLVARRVVPRVQEVLEARQSRISQDLDRADELSEEAEEAKKAFEALEAQTRAQAAQFRLESAQTIKAMEAARFSELDAELSGKLSSARESIARRVSEAQARLKPVARDIAAALIEKIAQAKPGEDQVIQAMEKR